MPPFIPQQTSTMFGIPSVHTVYACALMLFVYYVSLALGQETKTCQFVFCLLGNVTALSD